MFWAVAFLVFVMSMFLPLGYFLRFLMQSLGRTERNVQQSETFSKDQVSLEPSTNPINMPIKIQDNELERMLSDEFPRAEENKSRRLFSLKQHKVALATAFRTARRRIVIVSPYISGKAIKADGIHHSILSVRRAGVEVLVFTCTELNRDSDGNLKGSASEALHLLQEAGASVYDVDRIHQKTLIVDNACIADGSFNWLSAERDVNNVFQRQERTQMIIGCNAPELIQDELAFLAKEAKAA